jgi:hypothetical protein
VILSLRKIAVTSDESTAAGLVVKSAVIVSVAGGATLPAEPFVIPRESGK